jgi:hypothetical protein
MISPFKGFRKRLVLTADKSAVICYLQLQEFCMDNPIALKLIPSQPVTIHRVTIDRVQAAQLKNSDGGVWPAIVVTHNAAILPSMSAGMIDAANVVAVLDGNWADALLVVLPTEAADKNSNVSEVKGDAGFLADVEGSAPDLASLAAKTISAIRAAGVDGELVKTRLGRWVNQPINTFTLKAQPRAGNLHFTLYGNPETYSAGDFLLKDQNSYSRGWVRSPADVRLLANLARQSHDRRNR